MPPIGAEKQAQTAGVAGVPWTLPAASPAVPVEFVLARYRRRGEAVADAAGIITVNLGAPPLSSWWLVARLVVRTDAAVATEARVYVGEVTPTNEEDQTPAGNGDVSEYPRGLYVAGGADLIVQWTGAAAGDMAYCSAQVAEMTKSG